ncbi:MAG: efflux RND transporter periplasmic adaptor subunit [Desulfobacterales bacterium]|nr:efflux RND transporter periplasmic adaptor subunit [Desulfobacterales bacterium]MDX2510003.1 efflux RND transporter periplasmic adaptor subunit [Desulfobacterales bacterium]
MNDFFVSNGRKQVKKLKLFFKIFALILILIVFGGTLVFLYNKSQKKPVVFETKSPFITNIIKKTVATGSIVPRKEIEIKPQISGIIEEIFVEPGDKVKKDDLIARIRVIPNMISLNNAEVRLNLSRINLDDTKRELDRRYKLYKKGIISASQYQEYEMAYNSAREEMDAADNNLQLIKAGVRKNPGEETNTLIRSTIDGMILDIPVKEGKSVIETNNFNAGTTIAVIADMMEMIFEGKVDESEVGKIKAGMNLILSVGAVEKEKFNAILEYISPKGVEEEGAIQFEIRAKMNLKKSHFIRAGYSANADIVLEKKDSVLALNESLLQFEGDRVFVEVENEPEQFDKRYIEVGLSDGINIEIVKGLSKEDKIKVWNKLKIK